MCRPEKFPNAWRTVLIASRSSFMGLMKMSASSAYMEILHLAAAEGKGERIPCCVANSSSRCRGSMARMKSMGDRGSPWRTPLPWLNLGPCWPFSNTVEVAVRKRMDTHSRQRGPKPRACSSSSWLCQKLYGCLASWRGTGGFVCAIFVLWSGHIRSCHGCFSFLWTRSNNWIPASWVEGQACWPGALRRSLQSCG